MGLRIPGSNEKTRNEYETLCGNDMREEVSKLFPQHEKVE